MMSSTRLPAALVAGTVTVLALLLLIDRGGLIAGSAFIGAGAMLAKLWFKPSANDLWFGAALATILVAAWAGTHYYVISKWESGEVVELTIDTSTGAHTARLWVMDVGRDPVVYYDAEPEVANSLLAGRPVRFTRAGEASIRIPKAKRVDALPADEANLILEAMTSKYAKLNSAAVIYYAVLGRSRGRVALVARLVESNQSNTDRRP